MNDASESSCAERARIDAGTGAHGAGDLRLLATRIGLEWQRARRLWSDGLLSFDPDAGAMGDGAREAEFLFLGRLAALGLTTAVIAEMVRDLHRPYAYDLHRLYFDWADRTWKLFPEGDDPEERFFAMLSRLDPRREAPVLLEVRELVESALDLARGRRGLFRHVPPEGAESRANTEPTHLG